MVSIEQIIQSKGAKRAKLLNEFLATCSERQRCFLAFVSSNPILTNREDALSHKDLENVSASCKDKDTFLRYASFTYYLRDLWLKYESEREQMKKALCYFTAYYAKMQGRKDAVNACNTALAFIPDAKRKEAGEQMSSMLNQSESISMESDVYTIDVRYDDAEGKLVVDSEDAEALFRDAFDVYSEYVSSIKAYEKAFTELSRCETVGEDGDAIFIPLLHSFDQLKSKDAFSVYSHLPAYDDMQMSNQDYERVKLNIEEWIGKE